MLRRGGVAGVLLVACWATWVVPAKAVPPRATPTVPPAARAARKPTPIKKPTAAAKPAKPPAAKVSPLPPVAAHPAFSYLLVDARSGRALEEHGADTVRPAGSFPQLMVLLLSLEQVALGVLPLDVPVAAGPLAAGTGPAPTPAAGATPIARAPRQVAPGTSTPPPVVGTARIPLRENETYLFSDLLKAIAVSGADDATVAVAETIAGSVPASLELMNARGQRLGLSGTTFTDLGRLGRIPDAPPSQTTARDLGRVARTLLEHDLVVQWTGLSGLPFQDGAILLRNVNPMVGAVPGVDGLHVSPGLGVVATGERAGLRLIAVVLGGGASADGYALAAALLERGFSNYERVDVIKAGERVNLPIRVIDGSVNHLIPVAERGFALVRRRGEEPRIEVRYQVPEELAAPVQRNQPVGEVIVQQDGAILAVISLVSPLKVAATGILLPAAP